MKLSIIVPVYNVRDYLPKCVESLLAQQAEDCEILLVDDGSTDGESGPLCDCYAAAHPDRVRALHKENGGLGDARDFGLRAARGEYVLFVDSDDYLAPDAVEKLLALTEPGTDIVIFGFYVDRGGSVGEPMLDSLPAGVSMTLESHPQLLLASPNACNKLWRRSLFLDHDIRFPSRVWYEDLSTTGKLLACAERIIMLPEALYYYVVREGSITRNTSADRNREIITALESVTDWFCGKGLYKHYSAELEALAVYHVYMTASVRVLRIDPCSPVLEELRAWMQSEFPGWRKNAYVRAYPARHRLILQLLRLRCYRLIRLMFALKER